MIHDLLRVIGQQQVVPPHQLVADGHDLAEHLVGRIGHADVVAAGLEADVTGRGVAGAVVGETQGVAELV